MSTLPAPVFSSEPPRPAATALVSQEEQEAFDPHHKAENVQDQRALAGGVATRVELKRRVEHAVQARQQNLRWNRIDRGKGSRCVTEEQEGSNQ